MALRSFRLENHRSFSAEAELSLLSAYGRPPEPGPVAAVYGANAAGKSNLLDGLRYMARAVRDSYRRWDPNGGVPRSPFRLDGARARQPSTYVVELLLSGTRHLYGFVVDDDEVIEEWLHAYPKGRRRILFERQGMSFEFGESLRGSKIKTDLLSELTRPNALFLSLAAQVGIDDLSPVHTWFVGGGLLWSDTSVRSASALLDALQGDHFDSVRFLSLLRAADVGISEVVIEKNSSSDESIVLATALGISPDDLASTDPEIKTRIWRSADRLRGSSLLSQYLNANVVRFRHGPSELFDLADESSGTRSWLTILPSTLAVLGQGGVLVIDEIDSTLHPNLTALLIAQFQSRESNPHGAQLLFSTHDATLLGSAGGQELLARDQIWFVEKDAQGASRLYPLTDFHPRSGENRERRYLTGSYGGIPVIGRTEFSTQPKNPAETNGSDDAWHGGRASAGGALQLPG